MLGTLDGVSSHLSRYYTNHAWSARPWSTSFWRIQRARPFALQQMILHECDRFIQAGKLNDMIPDSPAIEQDRGGSRILPVPVPACPFRLLGRPGMRYADYLNYA